MDDSPFKIVAFQRDAADPEVVAAVERLLDRAKRGELRGLSIIGETRSLDGRTGYLTGRNGVFSDGPALAGLLMSQVQTTLDAWQRDALELDVV